MGPRGTELWVRLLRQGEYDAPHASASGPRGRRPRQGLEHTPGGGREPPSQTSKVETALCHQREMLAAGRTSVGGGRRRVELALRRPCVPVSPGVLAPVHIHVHRRLL